MALVYDIYAGSSSGGPVDYTTPIATVSALTWVGPALSPSSTTKFGVRARDTVSGLGELNTDAVVTIVVDPTGVDLSALPPPPQSVRATALAAGAVRVEWAYPQLRGPRPTGFRVYRGIGAVDYTTPAATVPFGGPNRATLVGLTGGTAYSFGVRAYDAAGEEANTATATATAVTSAPAAPDNLTATATAVA